MVDDMLTGYIGIAPSIDDVINASKTQDEHLNHLFSVFEEIQFSCPNREMSVFPDVNQAPGFYI